ncbi:MAG TPA: hypothetical protein VH142_12465 [Polyangiaceae bacterium]|jgi:hypothetical protein|nr:hypothetical protein [Polyangiaceae bacterium]
MSIPRTRTATLALFLAVTAVGCGSSGVAPARPLVFTGEVAGTDARLAVVATAGHARFYFCGGATSYPTMTMWFATTRHPDGTIDLPDGSTPGFALSGDVGQDSVSGSITRLGELPKTFTASRIPSGSIAGLYEGTSGCGHVGVIVADESPPTPPVLQGACIGSSSSTPSVEQVNPLGALQLSATGALRVVVAGSNEEAEITAAAAPAL